MTYGLAYNMPNEMYSCISYNEHSIECTCRYSEVRTSDEVVLEQGYTHQILV